jgi:hypothetical protein
MISLDKILLMLGMIACSIGYVKPQDQYFEVLQVTSQEWVSGVRGGGRSINYNLYVKIKTDKPIAFDSIWVAGKKLSITPKKGGQDSKSKLAKDEVITLIASDYMGGPGNNGRIEEKTFGSRSDTAKAPIKYEGAALLKYVVGGSANYFAIPTITVLPTIYGQ